MIDWLEKLPDSMIGALAAGGLWFAFNYAVLAPRAIEKDHATAVIPQCMAALDRHQERQQIKLPPIGRAFGVPAFDDVQAGLLALAAPRLLSLPERQDRCRCAGERAARALRFDYAVHTASFRLIAPDTVAEMGRDVVGVALAGLCGVLPELKR